MAETTPPVAVQHQKDIAIVQFTNNRILDEANIADIGNTLKALIEEKDNPKLLLDFSTVDHLSSAALGMLIAAGVAFAVGPWWGALVGAAGWGLFSAFVADLESGSRSARLSGTPREDLTHGARSLYAKLADGLVYVTALRYEEREDR